MDLQWHADPIFAPRFSGKVAPSYARRASKYQPADGIMDIRPSLAVVKETSPNHYVRLQPRLLQKGAFAAQGQQEIIIVQTPAGTAQTQAEEAVAGAIGVKSLLRRVTLPSKQSAVLYAMAGVVFVIGLVVSLSGSHANQQVAAQVAKAQKHTEASVSDTVVPSTDKPSAAAVANYAVSPNEPRYLDIPKLKVHTRTLSEGVTKKGQLQVPWNIFDTGWYNASSQPGQNGAMLVDGHSGIGKMHGIFYQLGDLVPGDQIVITRGDGAKFTYAVAKVETVNVADVDMASMLVSNDTGKPGLNLITCAGDLIKGTNELNKRTLVYAVQQ